MSGWLLDTNVILELRRPRPSARVRTFVAGRPLEELFISTVTFAEIRYGIETIGDPIRRTDLADWLMHKVRPMFEQRVLEVSEDAQGVSPPGFAALTASIRMAGAMPQER